MIVLFIVHNLQGFLKTLAYLNYTSVHFQTLHSFEHTRYDGMQ